MEIDNIQGTEVYVRLTSGDALNLAAACREMADEHTGTERTDSLTYSMFLGMAAAFDAAALASYLQSEMSNQEGELIHLAWLRSTKPGAVDAGCQAPGIQKVRDEARKYEQERIDAGATVKAYLMQQQAEAQRQESETKGEEPK